MLITNNSKNVVKFSGPGTQSICRNQNQGTLQKFQSKQIDEIGKAEFSRRNSENITSFVVYNKPNTGVNHDINCSISDSKNQDFSSDSEKAEKPLYNTAASTDENSKSILSEISQLESSNKKLDLNSQFNTPS